MFLNAEIETSRLFIRPYKMEDAEDLFRVVSEPGFFQFVPEDIPTLDDVKKIVEWSMSCCEKNTPEKIYKFNLGIVHKEDNAFLGYCGLGPYDLNPQQIELYYGITEKYRGMSLAHEAARAVLEYGFNRIGLDEIVTTVHPKNISSIKILEKLGFQFKNSLKGLSSEFNYFEGYDFYNCKKIESKV